MEYLPLLLVVLCRVVCGSAGVETRGVDISTPLSVEDFQCLRNRGFDFAIIRAYRSIGQVDTNAVANIANARAAGIPYVDVYMVSCPTCGNPFGQVEDMINALSDSDYGQIWLDIEKDQYWPNSDSVNQAFFAELLTTAQAFKTAGVYTQGTDWENIMGSGYTGGASVQLWYADWDYDPSSKNFHSFGGWTEPAIKQYVGDTTVCGVNVDVDCHY